MELDFLRASFGSVSDFDGSVVHAAPPFADSPLTNCSSLKGKVAVIKRGLVTISMKARAAAEAGAIGVIIINWADRLEEFACTEENAPTIPVVCVKQIDALCHLRDGAYVAFSGASRTSELQREPRGGLVENHEDAGVSSLLFHPSAMGSTCGFDGFLDMGDAAVFACLSEDGALDFGEVNAIADSDRIRGILGTRYDSIEDFDHAIETFDNCMRSWQERLSVMGSLGSSDSILVAHFRHLATARQLRDMLAQVEECNSACEVLLQGGDYLSVISDLTRTLSRLQSTEESLRGRDDLRISLLNSPQKTYALLQRALIHVGEFEEALTVCVQAKARSLSDTLEMERSYSDPAKFSVGAAVRIHGLQNDLEYEGRIGTVEKEGEITLVDVDGKELRVRRENLEPVHSSGDQGADGCKVWPRSQRYLPDMEWVDVQSLVQAQACFVVEYFLFSEETLGIWLVDRSGQIAKCQVVNFGEQKEADFLGEYGGSITRLLAQTRAAMGVAGRQATSHSSNFENHVATCAKEHGTLAQTSREMDDGAIDRLVMALENQSLDDPETMLESHKPFLEHIHGTPMQETLDQARSECKDVRVWLVGLLESVDGMEPDHINKVVRATTSWQQVNSWTNNAIASDFGIKDGNVRSIILQRISDTLNAEKLLQLLHALVMAPIMNAVDLGHEVLVIPHGVLFGIPWAALMDSEGHFWVERNIIRVAPSLRVAAAAAQQKMNQQLCPDNHVMETRTVHHACVCDKCAHQSASRGCKLVDCGGEYFYCNRCRVDMCTLWCQACPDIRKAVVIGNPSPNSCAALPFAQAEAEGTCSALQHSQTFDTVKIATTNLATKSWALQNLDQASWVHLACHGKLETNSIVLAKDTNGEEELSLPELQSHVILRSGSTVVLSACNTGMGQICGEGVIGLARGVLSAGGGAAVVSLWSISDESTKALMAHMYAFLLEGCDVPKAIRLAMLKMLGREPMESDICLNDCGPEASCETVHETPANAEGSAKTCLRSFPNQGEAEMKALKLLFTGGNPFLVGGRPLAVGNGLDDQGSLTEDCCHLLFGVSYLQVWSEQGPALSKAAALGNDPLKLVLLQVHNAISERVKTKGRHGSARWNDCILQQLVRAKTEINNLLLSSDSRSEENLRGRAGVQLCPTSTFSQPKHWASFVVTGARTTLQRPPHLTTSQTTEAFIDL